MAAAMARGWAAGEGGPEAMSFLDVDREKAEALAEEVGGAVAADAAELAAESDLVVLAVKPGLLEEVATELAPAQPPAVLSILAATPLARIRQALPGVPAMRVMPNQPVEVRRGVLCRAPTGDVAAEIERPVLEMLALLGDVVEVDEGQMEAAMAVMSSAPAYIALVSEVIAAVGTAEGLDPDLSARLVREMVAGTAELLRVRDPEDIRRRVASPGGATEAGLEALEEHAIADAFEAAAQASLARFR